MPRPRTHVLLAATVAALALFAVASVAPVHAQDAGDTLDDLRNRLEEDRKRSDAEFEAMKEASRERRRKNGSRIHLTSDPSGKLVAAVDPQNRIEVWLDDDENADLVLDLELPEITDLVIAPSGRSLYADGKLTRFSIYPVRKKSDE